MTDPRFRLSHDDLRVIAARIADDVTTWAPAEIRRVVLATLSDSPASARVVDVITGRILEFSPAEPPHRAAVIELALEPWRSTTVTAIDFDEPRPPADVAPGLPPLGSFTDVADWLDLGVPEVEWFADRGGWLRTAPDRLRHYRTFRLAKIAGGERLIEAPKARLRAVQRRILRDLLDELPVHPAAQGFVRGSSPKTFAEPHSNRAAVVRVDLRRCFETIGVGRVRHVFTDNGYPPAVARVLAELCTTATAVDNLTGLDVHHRSLLRRRHVPQGAPTSPRLANLVLLGPDRRIDGYARRNGLTYTRYGDDIAVSGDDIDTRRTSWVIRQIVEDSGFAVHPDKIRIMPAHQRQRLAGLVVNDRPQVARRDYDRLKALLHNAIRTGAAAQNRQGHTDFRAHVHGLIGWVGETNALRREKLLALAEQVDWSA